jgi:hypothetical protein
VQWGLQNVLTKQFFETWTEAYQDVISPPHNPNGGGGGNFAVGKYFPFSFYIRCRAAGGEPWNCFMD